MRPSACTRSPARRRIVAALLGLLLAILGADAGSATAVAAVGRDYFGVNAQQVFKLPQDEWDRQLGAIAQTGVGVVRRDAFWSNVEPTAPVAGVHRYTWTKPDAVIAALARHGLRWYPILDYSTTWAASITGSQGWKSAPRDPAAFAAYAAAFARRYGSSGTFWDAHPELPRLPVESYEVWNEPNLSEFWPDVTGGADRYGDLLAATAPALRAADPTGHVVVGGLSPIDLVPFLDELNTHRPGLLATVDAVAFHPYGTTFLNTGSRIEALRDWLDQHGAEALPIEITETGWATPPLPEDVRATRMATLVAGLPGSSCDVARFIAQTWLTPDVDASDPNDFFGIANADATLKPTGVAFVDAIAAVEHGTAQATSDPCAGRVATTTSDGSTPTSPAPSDPAPSAPAPAPAGSVPDPASAPPASILSATAVLPASPPATAAALGPSPPHVSVRVTRRDRRTLVVAIACDARCTAGVRVQRPRGAQVLAQTSRRLARGQRVVVRLPARFRGRVRIAVRVRVHGAGLVRVVRTLR
ncbi:MAG TPA: hypothetical protein VN635_13755 [Conexibacter sp.]|nr:hypothetical protein [Conexibacter sp.]